MRSKLKVVIDTNVFINSWFSMKYFYCDAVVDLVDNDKLYLLFSQDTIGELMYVAKNFAFHVIDDVSIRLELFHNIAGLFLNSQSVNTQATICPDLEDKTDEIFVRCAIEGRADYIISQDENSGMHNNEEIKKLGLNVVTAEEFIRIFQSSTMAL
jgi:putative PIN family toxin of toxin-antitoxin system